VFLGGIRERSDGKPVPAYKLCVGFSSRRDVSAVCKAMIEVSRGHRPGLHQRDEKDRREGQHRRRRPWNG